MARRAALDEKPFRPLDVSILNSVVQHLPGHSAAASNVVELPAPSPAAKELPTGVPFVQRLDQEKRILYTRQESQAIDRLVTNLAVQLNAQIKVSHVLRALTTLLLDAERQIDQRAGEHGPLLRPSNGDAAALDRFEREIAQILAQALRDAGSPR